MNHNPEPNSDELEAIARSAAQLPLLSPSRDLWSGIEARIEARVVALPVERIMQAPQSRPTLPWRRLAIAASLLIAATAGITYSLMNRDAVTRLAASDDSATVDARLPGATVAPVSMQTAEQTFDQEIGAMRKIIEERRKDLDPITISVLQKNLKLIDAAIAESKAALARDPASAFLMDRLTHAYDTKLQLLRGVASIPAHG
jgi:hypothetical protein